MASAFVFDVEEADFEAAVLERSRETPVLVDFHAEWCPPCKMLGPVLEKVANASDGRFVLAKIDSDRNPALAERFGVSGIPAVYLMVDGEVAGEFSGFLPEAEVRRFLDERLPKEADKIARRAADFAEVDPVGAERMYEQALELDAAHGPARAGLAGLALARGDAAKAAALVEGIDKHDPGGAAAEGVRARLEFAAAAQHAGGLAAAEAAVQAAPASAPAALALGNALAAAGRWQDALEAFVGVVERDPVGGRDTARPAMLKLFTLLGDGHELVKSYRKRLAAALF